MLINQKLIDQAAESKSAMEKKNSEIISLKNMLDRQQSEILKQGEQWAKEILLAPLKVSKKVEISQNGSTLKLREHATAGHDKIKARADFSGTKYAFETKRENETRPGFGTGHAQSEHAKERLSKSDPVQLATFKDVNYVWGKILAQNGLEGIGKYGQTKYEMTKSG